MARFRSQFQRPKSCNLGRNKFPNCDRKKLNWSKTSFAVLDSSYLLSASFDNTSAIGMRKG